jgi:hypothetical protein
MEITVHSKRIDTSSEKLVILGNEYSKSTDETTALKALANMSLNVVQQTTLIGKQIAQLDRNFTMKS